VVNASLNWASIVGIVLAVGGALLYFMRSFKPALARDYDVFFAAVGLLCGGILFFQGWRLDPILQFGQFLLAGTTVFFAYESVRLRGVTTEQARRSSYFDDDEPPGPYRPQMGGRSWDGDTDRFAEPEPIRRRIPAREDEDTDAFYRPRRAASRAAIPERAASRRGASEDWDQDPSQERSASRYSGSNGRERPPEFGARRRERDSAPEPRRGSRISGNDEVMPRSSRRGPSAGPAGSPGTDRPAPPSPAQPTGRIPQGEPLRSTRANGGNTISDADFRPAGSPPSPPTADASPTTMPSRQPRPRDNSSRFDD
jgi:Ycf66 protein N-terminus